MNLIGFCGKMGSGKSTAIQCLREIQHNNVQNIKFAAALYDIQEFIYRRISSVYSRPTDFIKDRKLLQMIGTEWGRNVISETLWVDLWVQEVTEASEHNPKQIIVCDDVRFNNEAEVIKKLGGKILKIESNKCSSRINTALSNHPSESGIDNQYIDAIIENNGSIDDLKSSLCTFNAIHWM